MSNQPAAPQSPRSYVMRSGRVTRAQQRALRDLSAKYMLAATREIDLAAVFSRDASCVLEIGFGDGEALLQSALQNRAVNYLGVEVHRPGVGRLLHQLEKNQLTNVRVFCDDAVDVLRRAIGDASLAEVRLFFPDPWPKKRHHKRRLVQADFMQLVCDKLQSGGVLHFATDWRDYAEHAMQVLQDARGLVNTAGEGNYAESHSRPTTKFERRGRRLGHAVWDIVCQKE